MINKNDPVIIEQTYNTSIDLVWEAITKVDQMTQWFFKEIKSFEQEVGFQTEFNVFSGERNFLHQWKITEVLKGSKIVYNWKYKGFEGDSSVTFELNELGNQTKLKLTHEGSESFPQSIPEFTRESCVAGWNYFIKSNLKEFLETDSTN